MSDRVWYDAKNVVVMFNGEPIVGVDVCNLTIERDYKPEKHDTFERLEKRGRHLYSWSATFSCDPPVAQRYRDILVCMMDRAVFGSYWLRRREYFLRKENRRRR